MMLMIATALAAAVLYGAGAAMEQRQAAAAPQSAAGRPRLLLLLVRWSRQPDPHYAISLPHLLRTPFPNMTMRWAWEQGADAFHNKHNKKNLLHLLIHLLCVI